MLHCVVRKTGEKNLLTILLCIVYIYGMVEISLT